jgi:glycosyltransferase involved in cell wall biosynthesis
MQRILHIIDSLAYNGVTSQLLVLAKGLRQAGIEVHICALSGANPRQADFAAAGINTHTIARRWQLDPLADWQLVRYVRKLQPDVVHTWDTVPGMFGPVMAGRPFVAGHYRIDRWKPAWQWALERRFLRHAARPTANSRSSQAWLAHHDIPIDKSKILPTSAGPSTQSDISRTELLKTLNLPPDARLIGVIGQLTPQKRVKDLIWAADLLRVLHNNLRLLVIGDGPLRSQLEEYARLASDLDHIRFLGAGNDTWRITPHLDVLWNASENTGLSAAILEAMVARVPVVASDTPSNRELITDGETGYLIPPGTRAGRAARARLTDRILTDAELASRLAKAAAERVARCFSTDQMLQQHLALYEEVSANHRV